MEANIGRSLAKVLTEHAVLVVSGFKLDPRPGIFTVLDLHKMDVACHGATGLVGADWSSVLWTKAGRLVLLLRGPFPLCTLSYFLMNIKGGHLVIFLLF